LELNETLAERVEYISGQNVYLCYQCGKCSGDCPITDAMDFLPSTIIRMVQLDDKDVLNAKAPWKCQSCFMCTVRCPRGIDVAKVMEAVRQITLRAGINAVDMTQVPDISEMPPIAIIGASRKMQG